MEKKAIGILTGGGDCGGLNAVIKGAAQMALSLGWDAYAIPNGYAGLYNLITHGNIVKLDEAQLEQIDVHMAGSIAGNARVKISKIDDDQKYTKIRDALAKYGITQLIISGGDDTGSVVIDLQANGIPCIHVPKTMDLDLQTYSVGGESAIENIAEHIRSLRTTGLSHNRVMIMEVFGRYAGHTAFRGGIAGEADAILIPEVPVDLKVLYEHMKQRLQRRIANSPHKKGTYMLIVSEGLSLTGDDIAHDESYGVDAFGHVKLGGVGKLVRDALSKMMHADDSFKEFMMEHGLFVHKMNELPDIRECVPNYLIRSGDTFCVDICFGRDCGMAAVQLLNAGISGVTVTGVENGKIGYVPTPEAIKQRHVDPNMVAFYEMAGICFGRRPADYAFDATEMNPIPARIL